MMSVNKPLKCVFCDNEHLPGKDLCARCNERMKFTCDWCHGTFEWPSCHLEINRGNTGFDGDVCQECIDKVYEHFDGTPKCILCGIRVERGVDVCDQCRKFYDLGKGMIEAINRECRNAEINDNKPITPSKNGPLTPVRAKHILWDALCVFAPTMSERDFWARHFPNDEFPEGIVATSSYARHSAIIALATQAFMVLTGEAKGE